MATKPSTIHHRSDKPGGTRGVPGRARKQPISRHSLHQDVADTLRQMIIHSELLPGEKIPVAALCESLDVSPTPLREALKVLAEERLVTIEVNRGARVAAYTAKEAVQLFEVIASLESLAAELSTERMDTSQRGRLEDLHRQMSEAFEADERTIYFDLNSEIHEHIVQCSDNAELQLVHRRLMLRAQRGRYMAIMDEARYRQAFEEHEALMAAVRQKDAASAGTIWRIHLAHTGKTLGSVLS